MFALKIIVVAITLLLLSDFISTFFDCVPEHVFSKFHSIAHHGKNRIFIHYAVLSKNLLIILDKILGVLSYFLFIYWL